MAMCTSGSLSICGTAGICRSISTAVGTGSGSLCALSVSAGKTAPHCMREFYGYAPVTNLNVDVFLDWYGLNQGSLDGLGGTLQLRCGSTIVCSQSIANYTKSCFVSWTPPAGTYCVYFGAINARVDGNIILFTGCWYSDTSSGESIATNAFSDDETVYYEGYDFV